ncbi:hypothetical protein [Bosea sp. ANAM02]|uniref:hypothetical protein n=1 Tax=Bosea sp. ANAM02 TaxID=2020412 RepID=UPI00140EA7E9|nr:hypothetical protein [Bosea sp. ANAM02]BCB17910.1 hypothetical protein OCUBac02_08040 [Bosea sp. ANAM02]
MAKSVSKTPPKPEGKMTKRSAVVQPDWSGKYSRLGGSTSDDWNALISDQAVGSLWCGNPGELPPEKTGERLNAAYAFLMRSHLKDELEAMMATQMFAAHNAAMECYRRAMIPAQPMVARDQNLNQANKLSRTMATLMEAMSRHRGKATQQKVTVEHVHVYQGGQAAFGQFNGAQPTQQGVLGENTLGGGVHSEVEDQSHGKPDGDALEPPMLCADPLGNVLPIAGHAERKMPAARRRQSRRAQG